MRVMKLSALLLAITVVAAACSDSDDQKADATWPDEITFGFVPSNEQEHLQDQVEPCKKKRWLRSQVVEVPSKAWKMAV